LLEGKLVKVHATCMGQASRPQARAGEVILADKSRLLVACGGGGSVELQTVQLEGRKAVRGVEWVMGRGVKEGDILQ
jgi:methionyl-tRNA formyltransferase